MLTAVDEQLLDEYFRMERIIPVQEEALANYIHGSLSRKLIGTSYQYYLQWREGDKIKSKYIPRKDVPSLMREIKLRNECKDGIKAMKRDIQRIRRVLGAKMIEEYRKNYETVYVAPKK